MDDGLFMMTTHSTQDKQVKGASSPFSLLILQSLRFSWPWKGSRLAIRISAAEFWGTAQQSQHHASVPCTVVLVPMPTDLSWGRWFQIAFKKCLGYGVHLFLAPQAKLGAGTCFCWASKCLVQLSQHTQEHSIVKQKSHQTTPEQVPFLNLMSLVHDHNFTVTPFYTERIYYFKNFS